MIPADEYKHILDIMPIPAVDLVVVHEGKVLLVKRTNEPEKGKW